MSRAPFSRTRWLIEKLKAAGGADNLRAIFAQAKMAGSLIENEIAEELRFGLKGLAEKTMVLGRQEAAALVKKTAADFLELANLSVKGDDQYIDFILNILIKANIRSNESSVVHYGVVTFYAAAIALEMGVPVSSKLFQWIKTAALLHDIAKLAIEADLLQRAEPTSYEMAILKEHLPLTVFLLSEIKWLKNIVDIVKHHHDRTGDYADWLVAGREELASGIRLAIEILMVADSFDGMTSKRDYKKVGEYVQHRGGKKMLKKQFAQADAIEQLRQEGFDHHVLAALGRILERGGEQLCNIEQLRLIYRRNELKLVWFGIEHLIKKNVIPFNKPESDEAHFYNMLRDERALLWLISDKQLDSSGTEHFVDETISAVHRQVQAAKLGAEFKTITHYYKDFSLGSAYILLFRALMVDRKMGSSTFTRLVKIFARCSEDFGKMIKVMDRLKLIGKSYADNYFDWVSGVLHGEETADIPDFGEKAFIRTVDDLFTGGQG